MRGLGGGSPLQWEAGNSPRILSFLAVGREGSTMASRGSAEYDTTCVAFHVYE